MKRRDFLKFLFAGAGAAAAAVASSTASPAFTAFAPLEPPAGTPGATPEPAVATEADMERAKIEQSQWGYYRRRYWRPRRYYWRRRHYPAYRRRYYRPRYYRRRYYY